MKAKPHEIPRGSLEQSWPASSLDFHIQRRRGWLSNQSVADSAPNNFYDQKMSLKNLADNVHPTLLVFTGPASIKDFSCALLFGAEFNPTVPYLVLEVCSLSALSSFCEGPGKSSFFSLWNTTCYSTSLLDHETLLAWLSQGLLRVLFLRNPYPYKNK